MQNLLKSRTVEVTLFQKIGRGVLSSLKIIVKKEEQNFCPLTR